MGWLVIGAFIATLVMGYVIGGDKGPIVVCGLYIGLILFILLSMAAYAIGELVRLR